MRAHRTARALAACASLALVLAACEPQPLPPIVETTPVKAVDTPPPVYPMALACEGIGGVVELLITVGPDGTVTRATTNRGSGHPDLDAAGHDAVRQWRFRAATRGGQPVATEVVVPITFNVPPEEPEDCYYLRSGRTPPGG